MTVSRIKVRIPTRFPSSVSAASPLTLATTGGAFAFGLDIAVLRTSLDPVYYPISTSNFDNTQFLITNAAYGASVGLSDNGPAIQAAINAAAASNGTVIIPTGNFQITTGVTLTSGVNLSGNGRSSKFTYNGTGTGLTVAGSGIDSMFIRGVNFVTNDSVSAISMKVSGVNSALDISGNKFTGGKKSLNIVGTVGSGSYGIDIFNNNFEGNATTTVSVDIAPTTAGYAQAIHVHHNNFTGFVQAVHHTNSDSLSVHHNRIERHFAATSPAIHTDTSNGVSIAYNYFEDDNSNQVMIESGSTVNSLIVEGNRFYLNVGGGTNTGANALKTTATAGSIVFSNNYIQSLSALSVVGNIIDTGASPIFARANTFNFGTAAYGFAGSASVANTDIDGTQVIAGSFSTAQQQVASITGTGKRVRQTSPALITPDIGDATGHSLLLADAGTAGHGIALGATIISANSNGTINGNAGWAIYTNSVAAITFNTGGPMVTGICTPVPTTKTANYTHTVSDGSLIFNGAGSLTLTLLAAATYPGRWLYVRTIAAQTVVSASSNVVPLVGGAAGTAILAATAGKWAWLQSDGTSWQIMAGN